jgi:hypothetical protein
LIDFQRRRAFFSPLHHTNCLAHRVSCAMFTDGSFPKDKVAGTLLSSLL